VFSYIFHDFEFHFHSTTKSAIEKYKEIANAKDKENKKCR